LEEHKGAVEYAVIGIQQASNTKALFDIADSNKVEYLMDYECDLANVDAIITRLKPIIERNDFLYITIDLDGFSSAYAPGVSAPSPMGFTPQFVFKVLKHLLETEKVISCDIAELNPRFDRDNVTGNLAARLVDFVVGRL
jgi:formiminoglutamase